MWLEAYRLLDPELGEERKVRWRREIEKIVIPLVPDTIKRLAFPWYNSPYIGTSPNHYAQWASLLLLAGHVFRNDDWVKTGAAGCCIASLLRNRLPTDTGANIVGQVPLRAMTM